jgi:hypothetical protein
VSARYTVQVRYYYSDRDMVQLKPVTVEGINEADAVWKAVIEVIAMDHKGKKPIFIRAKVGQTMYKLKGNGKFA